MLGGVFLEPLVAPLPMVKAVLDNVEGVIDPATDLGLEPFDLFDQVLRLTVRPGGDRAALSRDVPRHLPVLPLRPLRGAGITRISNYGDLFTMQQVARRGDIRHVGRRGGSAMHQPGCGIDLEVGLGTTIILLALTGMTPLGIAGVVLSSWARPGQR